MKARQHEARIEGRFAPGARCSPLTEFKVGQRSNPDGEVKPGQRLSPGTEFKPGQLAPNKLPVGSVTVRTFRGVKRAWVKVAEPNKWRERSKLVWEKENGRPVPRGLVIHHRDRDSLNDAPSNLQALTRKQHALEHLADVMAAGFGGHRRWVSARDAKEIS